MGISSLLFPYIHLCSFSLYIFLSRVRSFVQNPVSVPAIPPIVGAQSVRGFLTSSDQGDVNLDRLIVATSRFMEYVLNASNHLDSILPTTSVFTLTFNLDDHDVGVGTSYRRTELSGFQAATRQVIHFRYC